METTLTHLQKLSIVQFLTTDRMSNYGYDKANWNRIRSQRQRAKNALWAIGYNNLPERNWEALLSGGRLTVSPEGTVDYIMGQSNNEEVTNMLRRLVNPNANWVS